MNQCLPLVCRYQDGTRDRSVAMWRVRPIFIDAAGAHVAPTALATQMAIAANSLMESQISGKLFSDV
jgi:hypothetical protein